MITLIVLGPPVIFALALYKLDALLGKVLGNWERERRKELGW